MIHDEARVADSASLGHGLSIWQGAVVREDARIGDETTVGLGAYIGSGVTIGNRCKIQNFACVYEPAWLGEGVFVGPGAILTNDRHPRAMNIDGSLKGASDWNAVGVVVGEGASIGAHATCVAPLRIGQWAMVAAGSVVTRDVPDFALAVGVPARLVGWVGRAGRRLIEEIPGVWNCPLTGERYVIDGDGYLRLDDE